MTDRFEDLFTLIFDSITEGVFTIDRSYRITSFNRAAEKITGTTCAHALGRRCYDVFRSSICQRGCALRQTLDNREPRQEVRVDILNAKMVRVPISVSTALLKDTDGQVVGGVEIFRDLSEVERLREALVDRHRFRGIIGKSNAMREIFALIPQIAGSDAPVLISGPTGTGKELVAQSIHDLSSRESNPFVRVNCGALPDTLFESELFGYKRGAFTGATADKPGRFQQADGGTLFLDEIGDISPVSQVKLLRALEEGEIQPLGGTKSIRVNIRLVSATNRDLLDMVRSGAFREDLYYRIRVIPIELPPLSKRRRDIPLLVAHFMQLVSAKADRTAPEMTENAMRVLYTYDYPGNVRELRNIIERTFVLCTENVIDTIHLPREVVEAVSGCDTISGHAACPSEGRIAEVATAVKKVRHPTPEMQRLLDILEDNHWNRTATADALCIGRTTLWRRMKAYGLV